MKKWMHDPSAIDQIERYNNELDADMEASDDWDFDDTDFNLDQSYELLDRKDVRDSDGLWTEYSLYYDALKDRWVTVFGDHEIYTPEDGYFDNEFDNEAEAYEFFEDYEGICDEDEEF